MAELSFIKSSYSSGNEVGECVEVAIDAPARIAVRDSKFRAGRQVEVAPAAWRAFLAAGPGRRA